MPTPTVRILAPYNICFIVDFQYTCISASELLTLPWWEKLHQTEYSFTCSSFCVQSYGSIHFQGYLGQHLSPHLLQRGVLLHLQCRLFHHSLHSILESLNLLDDLLYNVYALVHYLCCEVLWILTNTQCPVFTSTASYRVVSPSKKKNCMLFLFNPLPDSYQIPANHWRFYCLYSFAFSKISYSWNYTVGNFFRLVSFI